MAAVCCAGTVIVSVQNTITLQYVHQDSIERFALLAKGHLLMPVRLLAPTIFFGFLAHYFRLVILFGWIGTTAVVASIFVVGTGYFTFVIAACVKALYEANAKVEGVPSMWGDVASKYVTMEYREASVKKGQAPKRGGNLQKMAAAAHGAVDSAVTGICAVDDAVHSAAHAAAHAGHSAAHAVSHVATRGEEQGAASLKAIVACKRLSRRSTGGD